MKSFMTGAVGRTATRGLAWGAAAGALAVLPASGLAPLAAADAATPAYTITDLGNLGYPAASPTGINGTGQVSGTSPLATTVPATGCPPKHRPCTTHPQHAFLYSGGKITDLGTLAGNFSYGEAINTAGAVAGYSVPAGGGYHAFLDSGGKMTDLGAYNIDTVAQAINDSGVIVGQTYGTDSAGSPFYHAFIYTGGRFQDLNNLIPAGSGYELTSATGINASGQIVATGYSSSTGQTHAFLLTPS